jgi:hypothetical protein
VAGWEEVVDQLADLGVARPPAATRSELAWAAAASLSGATAGLPRLPGMPAPAGLPGTAGLAGLAARSDAAAFGTVAPDAAQAAHHWRELDAWGRALRAGAGRSGRLRLALSPRSLLARHQARHQARRRTRGRRRRRPGSGTIDA